MPEPFTLPPRPADGRFPDLEAAEAYTARYEADRCRCGGSPFWYDPHEARHTADCRAPRVCLLEDLQMETSPGHVIFDTSLCYICGQSNYAVSHQDANGFPTRCPLGITREQADAIRRDWARA